MKALFNTYPVAFDVPGGGEVQLMAYYKHLPALGINPVLFDMWNPKIGEHNLAHFFSTIGGSIHFCRYIKQRGIPLVVTSSLWITKETRDLYPTAEIRDQLSIADVVITNSDMESDQLASVLDLPREKFATVYNAVEEAFLTPADPIVFLDHAPECRDFILNVGNIEPRKNQLTLIRALKQHHPKQQLVIIGHIRDKAYADQCFSEGGAQVRYVGPMEPGSVLLRSAMAACRLFVIPSMLETPSLAALEAAAQGARIVITEMGSTKEYFGDTVIYIDPSSVDSVALAIAQSLAMSHDPEPMRALIASRFTWPKTLPALVSAYKRLVK